MVTFEIKSEREISFKASHYKYHRRGRKAFRSWYPNGQKSSEDYYINGIYHRLNRPTYTHWYPNGQKSGEWYYIKGKYQSSKYWNEQGKLL